MKQYYFLNFHYDTQRLAIYIPHHLHPPLTTNDHTSNAATLSPK